MGCVPVTGVEATLCHGQIISHWDQLATKPCGLSKRELSTLLLTNRILGGSKKDMKLNAATCTDVPFPHADCWYVATSLSIALPLASSAATVLARIAHPVEAVEAA